MKDKGFTLIELMIVVMIISIITAIAIPNLMRARMLSNESATIGNLRAVVYAQTAFAAAERGYSDSFEQLEAAGPPYLDMVLSGASEAGGAISGYTYEIREAADSEEVMSSSGGDIYACTNYEATAQPVVINRTGGRTFGVDASGVIRFEFGVTEIDFAESVPI